MTCGEPAGVGPELAMAAWQSLGATLPFFWIGDPRHLPAGTALSLIDDPSETPAASAHGLPVLAHEFAGDARRGSADPANAQGVIDVIARAVDLTRSRAASAICTAPIHKKALKDGAGFAYPGHTEYLAALAGRDRVVMMLASPQLRVVPVTIHIAIKDVPVALNPALLTDTILITHAALRRDFGIARPRLAVAGLNPHAGEGGAMGMAEIEMITPTLDALRGQGLDIAGPLPVDTMFHAPGRARYDAGELHVSRPRLDPDSNARFRSRGNITLEWPSSGPRRIMRRR